jgi:hypothetical protein
VSKCCGDCHFFVGISTKTGRCSWEASYPPFWYVTMPAMVMVDEGVYCSAFLQKGENDE